ncbi:phosphotriesterase family protein [Salinarchaeum laminariae]|uniref:phosphotriesterase family protein n=1 Tax=Salinarchaeum laminariae TaxID=869888 RepID=UPI0020C14E9F|nr:hypothetical protein [Salinarchaeum laminariae]
MTELHTTQGALSRDDLDLILPHEHVFTDLGPMEERAHESADLEEVVEVIGPEIERAKEAGVTGMVEPTPRGVGRRVDAVEAVSDATDFPIAVATGIYQEPRIPEWAREASEDELTEWMIEELTESVDEAETKAAFIKVSTDNDVPDALSEDEEKILRAAARAGAETGAAIGSHTLSADMVETQLDVIEAAGYTADRFVWIHAQAEADLDRHVEIAERGAWIEYDWIGGDDQPDADYVERIQRLLEEEFGDQILLSQDRGWYDPSEPRGGEVDPYTYLPDEFLPALREAGVEEATIELLTVDNPFDAFAR